MWTTITTRTMLCVPRFLPWITVDADASASARAVPTAAIQRHLPRPRITQLLPIIRHLHLRTTPCLLPTTQVTLTRVRIREARTRSPAQRRIRRAITSAS